MHKTQFIKPIKLGIKLLLGHLEHIQKGYSFSFAKPNSQTISYNHKSKLTQSLKPNKAKVHNLKLAIQSIESVDILPGEIFSFWKIVGNPSKKNGFIGSRSIINGQVTNSIGGGLCQLSGLLYYLSLKSGLEILERHNHSMDIYTDETRFTPLGSDATVVYGYKDLKIRNNLTAPVKFSFQIEEETITVELNHIDILPKCEVSFVQIDESVSEVSIRTIVNNVAVSESSYRKLSCG